MDGRGGACGSTDLGDISSGGSTTSPLGSIPEPSFSDWYRVDFPMTTSTYGDGTPTIEFARNDGGAFSFDVRFDCSGTGASCGDEGGTASAIKQYSYRDNQSGMVCGPCTNPYRTRSGGEEWPDIVYVRVFRTSAGPSCGKYRLQISR